MQEAREQSAAGVPDLPQGNNGRKVQSDVELAGAILLVGVRDVVEAAIAS